MLFLVPVGFLLRKAYRGLPKYARILEKNAKSSRRLKAAFVIRYGFEFVGVLLYVYYQLVWLIAAFIFLLLAFPTLDIVLTAYWGQLLSFITLLVTASQVLLGFAFAAEAFVSVSIRDASKRNRFMSRSRQVKIFGLLCLLLSIGALVLNGLNQSSLAQGSLGIAILALAVEAILAATFVNP
jgi:hypothetical protein